MNDDLRKNGKGYNDPTPYKAIMNIYGEKVRHQARQSDEDVRFYKLLHTVFHICELAGFEMTGRLEARDKVTGKEYR